RQAQQADGRGGSDQGHARADPRVQVEDARLSPTSSRRCCTTEAWRPGRPQMDIEHGRLEEARTKQVPWREWGPYLSDRPWGTVREDYSENGDAWNFFTHDHARSRAYRWGEDGLGGISDDKQRLCFAV